MKYFSVCSGIGGFELGIERSWYLAQKGNLRCVGYSEINKYATAIYSHNFPEHRNFGDAARIVCDELPDFDFLVAGFPCQSFSVSGKRRGFKDVRGTIFFEIARILRSKRPRHFLLENVEGLVNHESGKTFQTILGILAEIGYFVETFVLDSKDFGVPQQRKRVFFIGHLADECEREILPFGNGTEKIVDRVRKQFAQTLISGHRGGVRTGSFIAESFTEKAKVKQIGNLGTNATANRIYDSRSRNLAVTLKSGGGGGGAKTGLYLVNQPYIFQRGRGYNAGGIKEIAPTMSKSRWENNNVLVEDFKIRRLTPVECARLQGFPDDWAKVGLFENGKVKEISDTQQYAAYGNAVTVPVIQTIITEMAECFE